VVGDLEVLRGRRRVFIADRIVANAVVGIARSVASLCGAEAVSGKFRGGQVFDSRGAAGQVEQPFGGRESCLDLDGGRAGLSRPRQALADLFSSERVRSEER
jgi:hypothetical protein